MDGQNKMLKEQLESHLRFEADRAEVLLMAKGRCIMCGPAGSRRKHSKKTAVIFFPWPGHRQISAGGHIPTAQPDPLEIKRWRKLKDIMLQGCWAKVHSFHCSQVGYAWT